MRRLIAISIAAIAMGMASAQAADLPAKAPIYKAPPPPIPFSWTGLYIGGNVGGASQRDCFTYESASNLGLAEGCHNATSFIGGGQIGFNWQMGTWVFGLEGSGDWASLKGNHVSTGFPGDTIFSKSDSLFTATARVGYAWDRALVYVKGGAAWVPSDYWRNLTGTDTTFATASQTRVGWAVGAGIEYAFWDNWSVAAEYDYLGMGTDSVTQAYTGGCVGGAPCTMDVKQEVQMATLRLNYRFNWFH
jgi:outer membrane immunogenic protein